MKLAQNSSFSLLSQEERDRLAFVSWRNVAEKVYGFPIEVARRLAFVRWLVITGRLGKGDLPQI